MKDYIIRDAVPGDAEELCSIYSYYVENTAKTLEYVSPGADEFRKRIENISSAFPYIVIEAEGKAVGYCYASAFRPRIGYKHTVEVSVYLERHQKGRGFGRALYEELFMRLRNFGIKNVNVCIVTSPEEDEFLDASSINFHKKMGFSYVGTFHGCSEKFGRTYNMTWMEKHIG